MAEKTVSRPEALEAARALYRQIEDVVSINGVLQAAQAAVREGVPSHVFGRIASSESVLEMAVKLMEERLSGVYGAMDAVFKAVGIDGLLNVTTTFD